MNLFVVTSCCGCLVLAAFGSIGSPGLRPRAAPSPAAPIVNPAIDYPAFLEIARAAGPIRAARRLTAEQFAAKAHEHGAVVLDARSADKYAMRHVLGAVNLPFTDFTAAALARVIPAMDTPVLIYCNNNFRGDEVALASKMPAASLNLSTYVALLTYGYTNVYELGPLLDVDRSPLPLVPELGSDPGAGARARAANAK